MLIPPGELLSRIHTIGTTVAETDLERQMLTVLESTIKQVVRKPVGLPWRPPKRLYELLSDTTKRRDAAAWAALERLWFFLAAGRVLADPLQRRSGRTRAGDLSPTRWVVAMQAEALAARLWDGPPPESASTEKQLLGEALFLLTNTVSPPQVLSTISRMHTTDLDWTQGTVVLAPPKGSGYGGRPYQLDLRARLSLGRLELFYRQHEDHRPTTDSYLLPAHWRRPKALAVLLRRWLRAHGLPDNVQDHLIAVRLIPLLRGPAFLAAIQAGLPAGWRADAQWAAHVRDVRVDAPHGAIVSVDKEVNEDGFSAMAQVRFLLRRIRGSMMWGERIMVAEELESLLPTLGATQRPPATEALVTEWVIMLLRTRRLRPHTVRTWCAGLYAGLAEYAGGSILAATQEELSELITELMSSQHTPDSQAVMKQRLRHFYDFLTTRYGLPHLNWRSAGLTVGRGARPIALVTLAEAEQALPLLRQHWPEEADALAVALILGMWVGLRREEICALDVDDLLGGIWGSLKIRRGKSPKARRLSPSALLTPAIIREVVEAYGQSRRAHSGSRRAPLLCTAQGKRWDPDELGKRLAEVLQSATGRRVSMHSLRRGCATFTLLRWAVALGRARWPAQPGTWNERAISHECLRGVLEALGTDATLVLHRLARLLGHAGPGVTVAHYVAADVLQEAWIAEDEVLELRPAIAADLLQCSRQALYKRLHPKARRGFDAKAVLRAQLDRLEGRRGGACRAAQERETAPLFPEQQTAECSSNPKRPRADDAPER